MKVEIWMGFGETVEGLVEVKKGFFFFLSWKGLEGLDNN